MDNLFQSNSIHLINAKFRLQKSAKSLFLLEPSHPDFFTVYDFQLYKPIREIFSLSISCFAPQIERLGLWRQRRSLGLGKMRGKVYLGEFHLCKAVPQKDTG